MTSPAQAPGRRQKHIEERVPGIVERVNKRVAGMRAVDFLQHGYRKKSRQVQGIDPTETFNEKLFAADFALRQRSGEQPEKNESGKTEEERYGITAMSVEQ